MLIRMMIKYFLPFYINFIILSADNLLILINKR